MKKTIFSIALAISLNLSASAAHAYDWDVFSYFNNTVSFMNDSAGEDGWTRNGFRDDQTALRDIVTNNNTGAQTEFWYNPQTGAGAGAIISQGGISYQYNACGDKMASWNDQGEVLEQIDTDCAY
ncbi:MAG: hypothetical protein K2X47_10700 [Bdellovibrionales bacterium]|nr:hypothetical protein [Bdellovibrionales bacterium]